MNMIKQIKYYKILSLIFLMIICSCATQLEVTYISEPSGADIYAGSTYFGKAPVSLYYTLTEEHIKKGVVEVMPVRTVWQSGVTRKADSNQSFNINESLSWNLTLARPSVSKGRQTDILYGQQHEQTLLMKEQVRLQQQQLELQRQKNIREQPKTCTSNYGCSRGEKCAKKENEYDGVCVGIYYYE